MMITLRGRWLLRQFGYKTGYAGPIKGTFGLWVRWWRQAHSL